MLHLHYLQNSRAFRILWLLEELGTPYQLTTYARTKSYLAPDRLKHIHPLGHSPILEVDGTPLVESGFIIEYLLRYYDKDNRFGAPHDDDGWAAYTFWMHFAEASIMPPLVMDLVFKKVVEKSPLVVKPISRGIKKQVSRTMIDDNLATMLTMMEQRLQNNHWFAGAHFSAVDVQMYFVGVAANGGEGLDASKYANILNWLKRCAARKAFMRAEQKGGRVQF